MTSKTRAAIYARISRDTAGEGLGVARQVADCEEYAAAKGYEVVATLTDNDISASGLVSRPSYLELKRMMEAQEVDAVVVWANDRLHRSMVELVTYIQLAYSTGVALESVKGSSINLATAEGRLSAHVFGAFNMAELEKTQERIKRKMRALAEEGAWPGRRVYGFTAKGPEIVEDEAVIIRELAERLLAGWGLNDLARDLGERGVPTISGSTWRASTVRAILMSARIAGHRESHGQVTFRNAWPGIIDEDTYLRLQDHFARGRGGKYAKPGGKAKYPLTGILRCAKCGAGLHYGKYGKLSIEHYKCPKVVGGNSCGTIAIHRGHVESLVFEMLFESYDQLHEEAVGSAQEAAEIADKRQELQDREIELMEYYGRGELTMAEVFEAKKTIHKQIEELPLPTLTKPMKPRLTGDEVREMWPTLELKQQRELLMASFEKILVHPSTVLKGAKYFDPSRVEVLWKS